MKITETQQSLLKKCSEYFTAGKVVSLGSGLPGGIPFVLGGNHTNVFMSTSGLIGDWSPSDEVSSYVDGNGDYVQLQPGSCLAGIGDRASIISGGYVESLVVQPESIGSKGTWKVKHFDRGDIESLSNNSCQIVAIAELDSVNKLFADVDSDQMIKSRILDRIVTDKCVLMLADEGFVIDEISDASNLEEIQRLVGVELQVSKDCRFYGDPLIENHQHGTVSKIYKSGPSAVSDIADNSVVMIDGFAGPGGMAHYLLMSLRDQGSKNLTIISNTAGIARVVNFGTPPGKLVIDHSILIDNHQVGKAIASYPVSPSASNPSSFELAYRAGEVDLELVPQGTLAERLRAGGAGVKYFYTPTGAGTLIAEGKDTRTLNGKEYIQEAGLLADYCIIRGYKADRFGNVVYKGTSRNFNAVMAPAAKTSIVEVDEIVEDDALDPELIVTPGLFVDRIVVRPENFSPYE